MKKTLSALLFAAALLPGAAQAFTFTLDAEVLKDAFGNAMQPTGLVVLTAATSGSFTGPTPFSFTGGDEIVVKMWDLSSFNTAGILSDITGDLPLTGSWDQGDALRMYWYPTLTLSSTAPGAGTAYGTYTDPFGVDGSAPWFTGAAGDTIALKFYTQDATFLTSGGSNPTSAGMADLTVVPEPSTGLFCLVLVGALGLRRRR